LRWQNARKPRILGVKVAALRHHSVVKSTAELKDKMVGINKTCESPFDNYQFATYFMSKNINFE